MENVKKNKNIIIENANHCVMCGEIIPEGKMVCINCELKIIENK